MRVYPNDNDDYSLAFLRHRLHIDETTEDFLFSLTPIQRNALCELRNRARMEPTFSAFPLLRTCDVEAWVGERW